ncbi:hypothetical protein N5079_30280 [Planotetraspora sp. A-T 1434]|uniref:hypothetical protein n=1 Tax=Planotetraspora sp. A-T 1434 TaxID=2979219 RepID=UPI0021BE47E7|nr:hypothetical protein [Planotetraspora sp. A-T 1434]MCT9934502.1 hypothetical protein [Planotetraspora sp. A-T 1434]
MPLTDLPGAVGAALERQPAGQEAWAAVLLVCVSTLAGAWLARRNSQRVTLWLAIASAMMLVTALVDLLPDAWRDAAESGTPLWMVALAAVFGFTVITYFTRKGCACPHDEDQARAGMHAPGLHRRVKEVVGAALYGGMGTAAALTLHRAIEGATLALTVSVVIILALTVHSASEGLALAALLEMAKQRLAPWLVVACLSPAVGVLTATLRPLPQQWVPVLLGMVIGVLSRTAIVGMRLAGSRQQNGRLSKRHLAIAATVSVTAGALLALSHGLHEEEGGQTAEQPGRAMAASAMSAGRVDHAATVYLSRRSAMSAAPLARPRTQADLREAVASGRMSLAQVLDREDSVAKHMLVARLLRALPGHDRSRTAALMAASGIDERAHVGDLSEWQRRSLLRAL